MPSATTRPHAAVRHTGLRYLLVGASNSALGFAAIWLALRGLDWPPAAANAAGYAVGFLWSFALNRRWTFAHRGNVRPACGGSASFARSATRRIWRRC